MRILHYALGFPPYRTGGLTKYCVDLMKTQIESGDTVALLWPGEIRAYGGNVTIKLKKNWNGIASYEIINPLPVALDEGIIDVQAYMRKCSTQTFVDFYKKLKPDVIHFHTLMGLHKEAIKAANQLNIRTVFTTHDYYGLCPKVTFYYNGKACTNDHGCVDCARCNMSALSLKRIAILQSSIYRTLKNTAIVKYFRKKHRTAYFEEKDLPEIEADVSVKMAESYQSLRNYYCSMLESVDCIHYNSTVTKRIYEKYITPKNGKVISITHRDIEDNRRIKTYDTGKLKLTYLGPAKAYKGFTFLISVLDKLFEAGEKNFELHLYSNTDLQRRYISHIQDGYKYNDLDEIFANTDVLVVPSQWYETFGFTVLEALSYGVPVITSEKVGAGDLLRKYSVGSICENNQMFDCIKNLCLDKKQLIVWNSEIQKMSFNQILDVVRCYGE